MNEDKPALPDRLSVDPRSPHHVAAVVRMMKNAIRFEKVMPITVSALMRRRWPRTSLGVCLSLIHI